MRRCNLRRMGYAVLLIVLSFIAGALTIGMLVYFNFDVLIGKINIPNLNTQIDSSLWIFDLLPSFSEAILFVSALATFTAAIYTAKAANAAERSSQQWKKQAVYDKYIDKAIKSRASLIQIRTQLQIIEDGTDDIFVGEMPDEQESVLIWGQLMASDLYLTLKNHMHNSIDDCHYTYSLSYEYINNVEELEYIEPLINTLSKSLNMYYVISKNIHNEYVGENNDMPVLLENISKLTLESDQDYILFHHIILMLRVLIAYLTHNVIHPDENAWESSNKLYIKEQERLQEISL
jgi:hypothetical protein